MLEFNEIKSNLCELFKRVEKCAADCNRDPADIKILAATKTVDAERINFACRNGIKIIGENRVQELCDKYDALDKSLMTIHFIGNLQTNKVKYIVDKVSMIHSVNSFKLACEIDRQCAKIGKIMDVLIEVNLENEESKSVISTDELYDTLVKCSELKNIRIKGLMAIPPAPKQNSDGAETPAKQISSQNICNSYEYFEKIMKLFLDISEKKLDNVCMEELSLGMSGDFPDAIRAGATIIRPGSVIFGKRIYPEARN